MYLVYQVYQVYQVYLLYMPERAIATDDIELLAVVVGSVTSDLPPQVTAAVARVQRALEERRQ